MVGGGSHNLFFGKEIFSYLSVQYNLKKKKKKKDKIWFR